MGVDGHKLALQALHGEATERIPVGPLTWGFDYIWKVANLEPWQLACGGSETWHKAHLAMLERHDVDIIWYEGAGHGPEEPTLIEETRREWVVRDNNNGRTYGLMKDSLALYDIETGPHIDIGTATTSQAITSKEEADRRIPLFQTWGEGYLHGLTRLINEVGDRALVLPHHSPGYIVGCYEFGFEAAMETMLYASAQRQIQKAIQRCGINPQTTRMAVALVSDDPAQIQTLLQAVTEAMGSKPDETVLKMTAEKARKIRNAFAVSQTEIEPAAKNGDSKQAIIDLVIERVALLATQL